MRRWEHGETVVSEGEALAEEDGAPADAEERLAQVLARAGGWPRSFARKRFRVYDLAGARPEKKATKAKAVKPSAGVSRKALRERWAGVDPLPAWKALLGGEDAASPFGVHEGRKDFRGMRLDNAWSRIRHQVREIAPLKGLDLSYSIRCEQSGISGAYSNCALRHIGAEPRVPWGLCLFGTFQDCDFTGTAIDDGQINASFARCRFGGAAFARTKSYWEEGFADCIFEGVNFRGVHFTGNRFERCRFIEFRFNDVAIGGARFIDCSFASVSWVAVFTTDKTIFSKCTGLDVASLLAAKTSWADAATIEA